jgi:hypothetical protein
MLSFLKKLFGSDTTPSTPAPYKVEAPVAETPKVEAEPFPVKEVKPAVKAKTARTKKAAPAQIKAKAAPKKSKKQ